MADNEGVPHNNKSGGTTTKGGLLGGWPALIFSVLLVAAALYAYSPRHYPPMPETRVHADDIIVIDVAEQDGRYVAVGELGNILITNDPKGKWHEAEIHGEHRATLTAVNFVAQDVAVAIGHSGWIIRSEDGGETWTEVHFDPDHAEPLLGLAGPYQGKLIAVGAFSQYFVSRDLGRSWHKRTLDMQKVGDGDDKKQQSQEPEEPEEDYNPFAAFMAGGGIQALAQLHYYDVEAATNGTLYLAGERGLIARSHDGGQTWVRLEEIYDGSFYGLVPLPGGGMLIYGMRGHAFVTRDGGKTWQRSKIPVDYSLFAGVRTDDGRIILAGAAHSILVSTDGGASFSLIDKEDRSDISDILHISGNKWLIAGIAGIDITTLSEQDSKESRSRS